MVRGETGMESQAHLQSSRLLAFTAQVHRFITNKLPQTQRYNTTTVILTHGFWWMMIHKRPITYLCAIQPGSQPGQMKAWMGWLNHGGLEGWLTHPSGGGDGCHLGPLRVSLAQTPTCSLSMWLADCLTAWFWLSRARVPKRIRQKLHSFLQSSHTNEKSQCHFCGCSKLQTHGGGAKTHCSMAGMSESWGLEWKISPSSDHTLATIIHIHLYTKYAHHFSRASQ